MNKLSYEEFERYLEQELGFKINAATITEEQKAKSMRIFKRVQLWLRHKHGLELEMPWE